MPNPSPYQARVAKKRRGKPGNLLAVTQVLWKGIVAAEVMLDAGPEPDMTLRIVHALSQACGQYARLLEVGELEERLRRLEERVP